MALLPDPTTGPMLLAEEFGIKYDEGVEGCKACVGGTLETEQSSRRIGAPVSHVCHNCTVFPLA